MIGWHLDLTGIVEIDFFLSQEQKNQKQSIDFSSGVLKGYLWIYSTMYMQDI